MVSSLRGWFYQFSQDHLDYHKCKDDYFEAKALLFRQPQSDKTAVFNVANNRIKLLAEELKAQDHLVVTLGEFKGSNTPKRQTFDRSGQEVFLNMVETLPKRLNLIGGFLLKMSLWWPHW